VVVLEPGTRCEAATTALLGAGVRLEIGPNNGDFETGDFTGWSQINSGSGGIAIDDGSFDPLGPGLPVPPFEGSYGAATFQGGPGIHILYTDVVLDPILSSAELSWADHLENHSGVFVDGIQEWRVEVWDPSSNAVLAELYSTEPGDPAFQGWTVRQVDLAPWIGQTIRLAFTQQDSLSFFNARLDAVVVAGVGVFDVEIDIKPGSELNRVNVAANGVIPVAILGSDALDVHAIDPTTLAFGPEGAPAAHANLCNQEGFGSHVEDVNDDGFDDLVTHYRTQEAGIAFEAVEACLEGRLVTGQSFQGCDSISVLACGLGFELVLVVPLLAWARRRLRG
jgi:hypothetical protein